MKYCLDYLKYLAQYLLYGIVILIPVLGIMLAMMIWGFDEPWPKEPNKDDYKNK